MARVSVCIVTHNNVGCITRTMGAVHSACENVDSETIVVENGSTDNTLALLNHIPDAKIIPLDTNLGFAAGYNLAMQHAAGDYVLLLNADAAPAPSAIDRMVFALDADPKLAAVGPCIVNEQDRLLWSVVPEPTVFRGVGQSFIRHVFPKTTRALREHVRRQPAYVSASTSMPVRMVDGVCIMLRRSALLEVGTFDEQFFFDYETVELGHRLERAGYTIAQRLDASVLHIGGGGNSRKTEADSVLWSTESGVRLYARLGRVRFTAYLLGTACFVALRAASEQAISIVRPSHRAASQRYRAILRSLWTLRRFDREWQSNRQIASIDG